MDWSSGVSWLASLARGAAGSRADADDRGDMGTAFGLDASFDAADGEPADGPPTAGSLPWEHRITRRSGL